MFLWKLIFQNVAKYLTQNFVNKTKSVWPEGKAETYFSFFPYKNEKIYYGALRRVYDCMQLCDEDCVTRRTCENSSDQANCSW